MFIIIKKNKHREIEKTENWLQNIPTIKHKQTKTVF